MVHHQFSIRFARATMACTNSLVGALPPKSPVRTFFVQRVMDRLAQGRSGSVDYDQASLRPPATMRADWQHLLPPSGVEPYTASKIAASTPMLAARSHHQSPTNPGISSDQNIEEKVAVLGNIISTLLSPASGVGKKGGGPQPTYCRILEKRLSDHPNVEHPKK
jgi:hypothetical protein